MLAISSSFALFSLILVGEVVSAKPHHSPLERRKDHHRRHKSADPAASPSPPSAPLAARDDSNVVYVDVWSTTTVTASPSLSSGGDDSDPPPVVGAVLAEQDGGPPNVVTVDVTSTVIKTVHQGGAGGQQQQQQQTKQVKPPPATTVTGTKVIPTAGFVAISTGKGTTVTIQDTATPTGIAQPSATGGEPDNSDAANQQWVALHNDRRRRFGNVPALQWRDDLVAVAKEKAGLCNKAHTKAAENLQWGSGMGTPDSAVVAWVDDEIKYYNFNNPTYSDESGHFTQAVWKNTSYVGCWISKCSPNTVVGPEYEQSFQTACEYDPAGNYVGEENFRENVFPEGTNWQDYQ
ncbi:uncharacterized protein I303_106796 [Kwoniella dejecticola CBS 10117]|uniref:SCP domain-containing protein n=1 Tax=Kwoniella dejecticola CBS 10117 TaxID=1296121 RepID=A0A1A5ZTP1_9TREE|nr:uncharacterized protein I303_08562 [Kwoniella dejecticola CBS 10117]OBR81177.1 hypothetical protein I303_08562 [Kwoniella dejecticola CBS 10117]